MFEIKNLHAKINDAEILRGIDLKINAGEAHAIMGPNGSGKSTLAKVIAGHPDYDVTEGEIIYEVNFKKINILELEPEERAQEGIFLAFQYPVEIPGVSTSAFLRAAFNALCRHQGAEEMDPLDFDVFLRNKMKLLDMEEKFINRTVKAKFSGAATKRIEIIQTAALHSLLFVLV